MKYKELSLIILAEECNETAQRISKALRFGLKQIQPGQNLTNEERIKYEFNDIIAAAESLFRKDINKIIDRRMINTKKKKMNKYKQLSKQLKLL